MALGYSHHAAERAVGRDHHRGRHLGKVRIYSGTRPATGGTATTQLAELPCNATFAPAASGGVLTMNAITSDASADATGTATHGSGS
jgi:hypothetical protein